MRNENGFRPVGICAAYHAGPLAWLSANVAIMNPVSGHYEIIAIPTIAQGYTGRSK
jgi:hypothetical protein